MNVGLGRAVERRAADHGVTTCRYRIEDDSGDLDRRADAGRWPGLSATIAGLAENTEYEVQVRATNAEGTGDWSDPPGSGSTDANAAASFTSPATVDVAENQTRGGDGGGGGRRRPATA